MEELVTDILRQKMLQLPVLISRRRAVCPAASGECRWERVGTRHGVDKKGLMVSVFRLPSYPTFAQKKHPQPGYSPGSKRKFFAVEIWDLPEKKTSHLILWAIYSVCFQKFPFLFDLARVSFYYLQRPLTNSLLEWQSGSIKKFYWVTFSIP